MPRSSRQFIALAAFLAACSGAIEGSDREGTRSRGGEDDSPGDGNGGSARDPANAPPGDAPLDAPESAPQQDLTPAPAHIRRLTAVEITNSLRDVFFGGEALPALGLRDETARHNFDNASDGLGVTLTFGQQLADAADVAATSLAAKLPTLLPCTKSVASRDERACFDEFVSRYGRRMFRAPVSDEQRTALHDVFVSARSGGDFASAIVVVAQAMMHSPNFLFRTELGSAPGQKSSPLTSYEIASALSYSLWRSGPDDALLDAAATGLANRDDVLAQARRMLADARAHSALRDFFWQWLEISNVAEGVSKNDPAFTPTLVTSVLEESRLLIEAVVWDDAGKATLADLLTASTTFADEAVAKLHGGSGAKGTTFQPFALDPDRRAGILTTPAFLAAQSPPTGFSPIFPGVFVRRKMLCQTLAEPPPGIPPPSKDPNMTTRQRFAAHSDSPSCQTCHKSIDDIGWGFERFDVLGRYRETEQVAGKAVPLTGAGKLVGTDVDGSFVGAAELARRLAQSAMVERCFASHLLEFMLGRDTGDESDRLPIDRAAIAIAMGEGKRDIRELLAQLTTTHSFLYRDAREIPGGL